jgi:hypothetical protein
MEINGQEISNKYGGGIVFGNNFTVNTNTPLDVRLTKTTKSELLDPTSWVRNSNGQYLLYTGMLVVVTNDEIASNNGIWEYIGPDDVESADPTKEENWVHLISGETKNTTINGNSGAFTLGNGLQLIGTEISAKGTGYLTVGTDGINIDSSKISDYGTAEGHDKLITKGYLDNRIEEFAGGVTGGVRYLATVSPEEFEAKYRQQYAQNGNMVKFNSVGKIYLNGHGEIDENLYQEVKEGDVVIYNENNSKWDYIPSGDDIEYTGVNVGDTVVINPTKGGNVNFAAGTLLTIGVDSSNKTITYSASEALSLAVGKANSALQSVVGDSETNDGISLDGFNTEFVNIRTTEKDTDGGIKVQSGLKIGSVANGIEQEERWEFVGIYTGEEGVDINEGDIVDVYNVFEDMKKLNPVYGDNNTILVGDGDGNGDNFYIPAGTKTVDYEKDSKVLIGELPTGIKLSCLTSSDGDVTSIIDEIKNRVLNDGLHGQISELGVAVYRKVDATPAQNGLATAADVKTYVDTHKSVVYGAGSVQVSSAYIGSETIYNTDLVWLNSID